MANFSCPGQVGDVHKPLDTLLDPDKGTELGQAAHNTGVDACYWKLLFQLLPRVGLKLLKPQRYLPLAGHDP